MMHAKIHAERQSVAGLFLGGESGIRSRMTAVANSLERPFASAVNATSERSVSPREHRKRNRTFALRNARQAVRSRVTIIYFCLNGMWRFSVKRFNSRVHRY